MRASVLARRTARGTLRARDRAGTARRPAPARRASRRRARAPACGRSSASWSLIRSARRARWTPSFSDRLDRRAADRDRRRAAPAPRSLRRRGPAPAPWRRRATRSRFMLTRSTGAAGPSVRASAADVDVFAKPMVSNTCASGGDRSVLRRQRQVAGGARQHLLGAAAGRNQADARPRRVRDRFPPPPGRDRRAARSRSRRRARGRPARPRPGPSARRSAIVARWKLRTIRSTSSQLPSCASSRSSIRLAPAEKLTASVETTSAANCARRSPRPSAASRWRRRRARSSSSAARRRGRRRRDRRGWRRRCRPRSTSAPGVAEEQHAGRRRHAAALAERVGAGGEAVGDERRHRRAPGARVDQLAQADRVGDLERAEIPAVAPAHRPIDVVEAVRDVGSDRARVEQRRRRGCGAGSRRPDRRRGTACGSRAPVSSMLFA